ncbi:hypothetical protein HC761_00230 [bacterium]|nr:hypothetical protein [bacterium]
MSKLKETLRSAAHSVRDAGRVVRKHINAEGVHSAIVAVVDHIEDMHPVDNKGAIKLRIARRLLGRILGADHVDSDWDFIRDTIADVVAIKKSGG